LTSVRSYTTEFQRDGYLPDLCCERDLGLRREITNVNGSGCGWGAYGEFYGTPNRVTLLHAMQKRGKTPGLATLFGGGKGSRACDLERI